MDFDADQYPPPLPLHPCEQRCTNHIRPDDDIEAIVIAAKGSALDRAYREHLTARSAADQVIIHDPPVLVRRYFETAFVVR